MRKYLQYFWNALEIYQIFAVYCAMHIIVFLCVNICANIYDISNIALKILSLFVSCLNSRTQGED